MKHFIIITNRPKDPDLEITRRGAGAVEAAAGVMQCLCGRNSERGMEADSSEGGRPDGCDFGTGRGRDDAAGGAGYGG